VIVTIGGTPVTVISKKQKIATKNSTEAELVALSDQFLYASWVEDFLSSRGMKLRKTTILQDNRSTIDLVTRPDNGVLRTKNLRARRAVMYEELKKNFNFLIEHVFTDEMIADILTKPLSGSNFHNLAYLILAGFILRPAQKTTGVRWGNPVPKS